MAGPAIVLGMLDGLVDEALGQPALDRLAGCGTLLDPVPLASWDDPRADDLLARAEVLVGHWGCPTLDAATLDRAPHLRLVAYAAGSVRTTVGPEVFARGIAVTSAAPANAVPVAEYTVAVVLLANKGAFVLREAGRDPASFGTVALGPPGNNGATVGLVGASLVGRCVVDRLRGTDLDVLVHDPYLSAEEARALGVEKVDDLTDLCARSRVLSVHAPDLPSTRGMVGAAQLAALPDGATVVNTARPALVDQDALVEALRAGRISAVLDVTDPEPLPADHPLLGLPNAFVTPHIAGAMGNELARLADLAVTEVERHAAGLAPLHPVHAADLGRIA